MAKRRQAAGDSSITCAGYRLTVINNSDSGTDFDILVNGDDGKEYNLQVSILSDRTALVQMLFNRVGILWPAFDFEFRADSANQITQIL